MDKLSAANLNVIETSRTMAAVTSENDSSQKRIKRSFQDEWKAKYKWLLYKDNKMYCDICLKHNKKSAMCFGVVNFRTSTLTRHAESREHRDAMIADSSAKQMTVMLTQNVSKEDQALIAALQAVYYQVKHDLATSQYPDFIDFLIFMGCNQFKPFQAAGNASYRSIDIANDMQECIAQVIMSGIDEKLKNADYISLLADESCDISVHKKLCTYCRVVKDCHAETIFIENTKISDGTAETVVKCLEEVITKKQISKKKIVSFGSDGASVMTGNKSGVGVRLAAMNPAIVCIHCVAHRLALVTSQSAAAVPYLKQYQETLTSIFYWFKHSAIRTQNLGALQEILDLPQIKIKEVHSVRWFSFYSALETVHRSWQALAMLLNQHALKDAKAKGILKDINTVKFLGTMNMLMDVIPIMTLLNLIFQKKDLDLSVVLPAINGAKADLQKLIDTPGHYEQKLLDELTGHATHYQDVKIIDTAILRKSVEKTRTEFVQNLIENLEKRFPSDSTNIVNAFAILSMKGSRFTDDLTEFGNKEMDVLLAKYGESFRIDNDNVLYVNVTATRAEWSAMKQLIWEQKYPTGSMSVLWPIIIENHADIFPNLIQLASIAMVLPVHTADVERGFSSQNLVKTHLRNRVKPETLQNLLVIKIEGPPIKEFDFQQALSVFNKKKARRLYQIKNQVCEVEPQPSSSKK